MTDNKDSLPGLPKGWVWTSLGAVSEEPQYGWTTSASTSGTLHLLRTTDITSGKIQWHTVPFCKDEPPDKEKYVLFDGDIVISRAGSVGYSRLIKNPESAVFASYLIRFKPLINEKYMAYFLMSPKYWMSISEKSLGIAIPNVNATKLKQIEIPLSPLPEQERIVTKIEELFTRLDAGVEALKKIKAQLKRYRQAVLKYAFEGKLTEEWREAHKDELEPASVLLERIKAERKKALGNKYKEPAPVDTSDLPELPEGWMWTRLSEVSELKNGINFTSNQKGEKGIPTIDVFNMYSKGINVDTTELYRVNIDLNEDYLLRYGDILFVRSSVKREGVGWASMFKPTNKSVTFCGFIIRARLNGRTILPEYLTHFMRTNKARKNIIGSSSQVTITNINQASLGNIAFPLTSLSEQQRIADELEHHFSVADEVERIVDQSLKQAQGLRQSILKQAFEGKLVPQDPNDEPAEKLLERIKAEKEQKSSEAKKGTRRRGALL